jgi:large subunit ribosomal protein L32
MIVPKRRTSRSKRNKRRSHHALAEPARSVCASCSEPKAPHRVCGHCGSYRDRTVIETDEG